jgi:hypothetical protein
MHDIIAKMHPLELSGSSTPGTTGHQLWPKILDTTGSLQRQTTVEPYTSYRIWPHHSWLKRRDHQTKKNWVREQSSPSLFLITVDVGRQDFATCLPDQPPSSTQDQPEHPVAPSRSFQYHLDFTKRQGLRKWQHLPPDMTWCGYRPHARLAASTQVQESIPSPPTKGAHINCHDNSDVR